MAAGKEQGGLPLPHTLPHTGCQVTVTGNEIFSVKFYRRFFKPALLAPNFLTSLGMPYGIK
jgi:hypothetical protein